MRLASAHLFRFQTLDIYRGARELHNGCTARGFATANFDDEGEMMRER
jgi:hypothetical protein